METTQVYGMPRIGDAAPEFKAVTTQGDINFPSDYKEKWAILFSHPAVTRQTSRRFAHLSL